MLAVELYCYDRSSNLCMATLFLSLLLWPLGSVKLCLFKRRVRRSSPPSSQLARSCLIDGAAKTRPSGRLARQGSLLLRSVVRPFRPGPAGDDKTAPLVAIIESESCETIERTNERMAGRYPKRRSRRRRRSERMSACTTSTCRWRHRLDWKNGRLACR